MSRRHNARRRVASLLSLSPAHHAVSHSFPGASSATQCPGTYNLDVLDGLDFLLAEMGKRGMRATVVMNNEWAWSGGLVQYVMWARGIASGNINTSAPCVPMGTDANGARRCSFALRRPQHCCFPTRRLPLPPCCMGRYSTLHSPALQPESGARERCQ